MTFLQLIRESRNVRHAQRWMSGYRVITFIHAQPVLRMPLLNESPAASLYMVVLMSERL